MVIYITLNSLSITLFFGKDPDAETWLENGILLHMKISNMVLLKKTLKKCFEEMLGLPSTPFPFP